MAESHAINHHPALAHHFDNLEQQREAGSLGMWVFLVTEIMFFGGLFLAYTLYRSSYPAAFAVASNHLDLTMGAVNTVVLICSSLSMAMAVYFTQAGGSPRAQVICLVLTMILGATFLGIKAVEYHQKYVDNLIPGTLIPGHPFSWGGHLPVGVSAQNVQMFFWIYFAMTGIHALHMIIGLVLLGILAVQAHRGKFTPEYHAPVELTGLYWHFVDIIWIFLFPLLYLLGRHLEHH